MYNSRTRTARKQAITVLDRKDITDYVRSFVWHMRTSQGRVLTARHSAEAEHMKQLMNDPKNTTYKSFPDFRDGDYFWHVQKVDFVRSNLRNKYCNGYVWYFVCNGCGRRVKYLYEYSTLRSPLCRICCRLRYQQPTRKQRRLSELLRRPYISTDVKRAIIKHAGITKDDIID